MAGKVKKVVALKDDPNTDAINALVEKLGMNGIGKTLFDHNRYSTFATLCALVLFTVVKAYQPRTTDPFFPLYKSTAAQIQKEHDAKIKFLNDQIAASKKSVEDMRPRIEAAGKKLIDQEQQVGTFLTALAAIGAPFAGPFSPVVLAGAAAIAAGFAVDGARKTSILQAATSSAKDGTSADADSSAVSDAQQALLTKLGTLAQDINTATK